MKKDNIFVLAFKLFLICFVIALGLSSLNSVTAPVIAQLTETKKQEAMKSVLPECDIKKATDSVYIGEKDGGVVGYAVNVITQEGYGGAIEMIVGFDPDFRMTGLEFISMSETPGLGTRAKEDSFLSQFLGEEAKEFEEIDAITGATITSKAVNGAINRASELAKEVAE